MRPGAGLLAWAILAAGAPAAHGADDVVPVLELSDEDVAALDLGDVSTADWEAVLGAPTLTARDFSTMECCDFAPYDPSDLDFRVWLGWHGGTNRIYCAVERADDVNLEDAVWDGGRPSNSGYGGFWSQDSIVQFEIDGDGRGGSREWFDGYLGESEEEAGARRDAAHRELQSYWVLGDLEGGWRKVYLVENGFQFGASWFEEPPYANAGGGHFGERPVIDVTEFYVTPFDLFVWDEESRSLVSELRAGGRIQFRIMLVDRDIPYGKHPYPHSIHSFPEGGLMQTAHGILLSRGASTQSPAVELPAASWATIKASVGRGVGRRDP